jgi:hypothetical protein
VAAVDKPTILDIVRRLSDVVINRPDVAALREMRSTVDSPAFSREIREFMRSANSDESRDALMAELTRLQRLIEELHARLVNDQKLISTIGVGGGVGIAGAGIVTAITLTVPAIAIFPVVAGIFMTFRFANADRQLNKEVAVCAQLVDELKSIRNELK